VYFDVMFLVKISSKEKFHITRTGKTKETLFIYL